MKYKTKANIMYQAKIIDKGEIVEFQDESFAKNLLERDLLEEIGKDVKVEEIEENTNGIIAEKTEEELEEMTVKELLEYAKKELNLELNKKDKKDNIIQEIQEAYADLEEVD